MNGRKEFEKAEFMIYGTFDGFYDVKIVSGLFRLLRPKTWIKQVKNHTYYGWNEMDEERQGFFSIMYTSLGLELNYDLPENEGTFWSSCRDHLKKIKDSEVLIGKIQVKYFGRYWNMGYFTLTKIDVEKLLRESK